MGTAPELPRPVLLARIAPSLRLTVEATPDEAAAIAARMDLAAVHSLTCRYDLRRAEAGAVAATGHLRARLRQTCVVTLEPFDTDLAEDFAVRFVPAGTETEDLDIDAEDEVAYEGDSIDLGEAACEQLALALDPFPRSPGAAVPELDQPERDGAFAALARLRPAG